MHKLKLTFDRLCIYWKRTSFGAVRREISAPFLGNKYIRIKVKVRVRIFPIQSKIKSYTQK